MGPFYGSGQQIFYDLVCHCFEMLNLNAEESIGREDYECEVELVEWSSGMLEKLLKAINILRSFFIFFYFKETHKHYDTLQDLKKSCLNNNS